MEGKAILPGMDDLQYVDLMLSGDTAKMEEADQMQEEHEKPYKALYEALTASRIDAFQFYSPGTAADGRYLLRIMSRSLRPGVLVQLSVILVCEDGGMIPLSHADINSFRDFRMEGIPDGETAIHWLRLESAA